MDDAIVVEGLVKRFGATTALDGVDLTVAEGSVLGLLGPNGAGKTTVVRILTTLLRADAGRVRVAGLDVVDDADAVRASIGLTGQYAAVDEYLTGLENLEMVGRLYRLGKREARARAGDRKSTRLNSSHANISYAVFCLKKKKITTLDTHRDSIT